MKKSVLFGALTVAGLVAGAASANTLDEVRARDALNCGVNTGLVGFAAPDASGVWGGFDIDLCRAVAAAIFGDPTKVNFIPTTGQTRFTSLAAGEVDMLARNSTWTYSRDSDLKLDFVAVNYYDGQGFLAPIALGVSSAKELDGATVCIQTGTTTELNLSDFFRVNNITYEPVVVANDAEAQAQYLAGACDVFTTDASGLAATRATFENPGEHVILPEIISKEPLGPVVRQGDDGFFNIARWTYFALLEAEELGVSSANVDEMLASDNPAIKRLLGVEGDFGTPMGLTKDWAYQIIKLVGNYSESYEKHVGPSTAIGLARGLNALWKDGGIQYSPPIR